jgi:Flp pilus assembly protein TadG
MLESALHLDKPHSILRPRSLSRSGAMAARLRFVLRGDGGGSLIEIAFVGGVVVTIFMAIMQMSLALFSYDYISNAARTASRYAMVRGSESCANTPNLSNCNATADEIQTYIQGLKYPGINSSNLTVTTTWLSASSSTPTTWTACATQCNEPGNEVKVVASYPFAVEIPFLSKSTLTMTSTSQMIIAQ